MKMQNLCVQRGARITKYVATTSLAFSKFLLLLEHKAQVDLQNKTRCAPHVSLQRYSSSIVSSFRIHRKKFLLLLQIKTRYALYVILHATLCHGNMKMLKLCVQRGARITKFVATTSLAFSKSSTSTGA